MFCQGRSFAWAAREIESRHETIPTKVRSFYGHEAEFSRRITSANAGWEISRWGQRDIPDLIFRGPWDLSIYPNDSKDS
jgi:hypothetical protein